jgi:hypothetical protein
VFRCVRLLNCEDWRSDIWLQQKNSNVGVGLQQNLKCNALAFHEENDFSYLEISRNRIEKLEGVSFSRLKILSIFQEQIMKSSFKSFINLKEKLSLSLPVKNILEITDETFCGLENLKYLDMSGNNTTDISSSVFQNMLPPMWLTHQRELCLREGVKFCEEMEFTPFVLNNIFI